jgi:hypothetical protein
MIELSFLAHDMEEFEFDRKSDMLLEGFAALEVEV